MEITKEEIIQKAQEWLGKEKFVFQNQNGAKIEVTPISACNLNLPINASAVAILRGFIGYLFKDDAFSDLLKDLQLPPDA